MLLEFLVITVAVTFSSWQGQLDIPLPESKPEQSTIAIGGDVMFEAELAAKVKTGLNPFRGLGEKWTAYDFRVVNLETTIANPEKHSPANKNFTFNAPRSAINALKRGGVGLVSLANNHAVDYGPAGLEEQMQVLKKKGLPYFGAGKNLSKAYKPHIVKLPHAKVAFIGLNDVETFFTTAANTRAGTAPFRETEVRQAIQAAHRKADIVIVYPHWGIEHALTPTASQKYWAHKFIDYGADLVVGAHPHVVQPTETYKGKKIFYSLGNFVFVGMWDRPDAMKGKYLEITIKNKKISKTKLIPYNLDNEGLPTLN